MSTAYKKKCEICGDKFLAQKSNAIYCSARCRQRASRKRKEEQATAENQQQTKQLAIAMVEIARYMEKMPAHDALIVAEAAEKFGQDVAYFIAKKLAEKSKIIINMEDFKLDTVEIIEEKTED